MKITFDNPDEAYNFIKSWTRIKSSYKTKLLGKEVKYVEILVDTKNRPTFANVHYKEGIHTGCETIDLSNKILLDKPEKKTILNLI